jgi:hypothetical protein
MRTRTRRLVGVGLLVLSLSAAAAWARSYWVADKFNLFVPGRPPTCYSLDWYRGLLTVAKGRGPDVPATCLRYDPLDDPDGGEGIPRGHDSVGAPLAAVALPAAPLGLWALFRRPRAHGFPVGRGRETRSLRELAASNGLSSAGR